MARTVRGHQEDSSGKRWSNEEAVEAAAMYYLDGESYANIASFLNMEFNTGRSPGAVADAIRRNKKVLAALDELNDGSVPKKVAHPKAAKNPGQVLADKPDERDPMDSLGLTMAYFDIEAWDLTGSYGPLLCVSILSQHDNKMRTFRQDDYLRAGIAKDMTHDQCLALSTRDYLETFHMTAGWYSKGYDIPHLNTRLAKWGERPMRMQLHLDGIWYFKGWRGLRPVSSKLKHVAEFLELPEQKPSVHPDVWLMARAGNKEAMDEVVERCEADTRITRLCIERALDMGLIRQISRYP